MPKKPKVDDKNSIKLKVAESVQEDVNKGVCRLSTSFMEEIGVRPGDIISIEGKRKTVCIADRCYPGDLSLNIIRIDGLTRRNANVSIGDDVSVRKAKVSEAKKVIVAPAMKNITVTITGDVLKRGLVGRAVMKGDFIALAGYRKKRPSFSRGVFDDIFNIIDEDIMSFGFGDLKFIIVDANPKQEVVISENTEVVFNPEAVEFVEDQQFDIAYEDIGGLGNELEKIREMVELPLKHPEVFDRLGIEPPKGVLLHGPPGTGKTLLARAVANETNSHFIHINGPEIMSKFYGQSEQNLRKKFDDAEKNAPSIIFIDEIDAIASKREEVHGEVERRVVAQLLTLMDGLKSRGKVVVIAATNVPNLLDPALRRPGRFDREIDIGVPSKEGRLDVLKIHTRNMPLAKNVSLKEVAAITHGFVGADLASLCKEAAMILLRRLLPKLKLSEDEPISSEVLNQIQITKKDFQEALKVVRPSALREVLVELPNVAWDDIGGLDEVKQELKESVEWPLKKAEVFKKLGISPPKGILLYGPPGTGKTLLAKAVANESEANFISVKGPELFSKWVGESEKAVREVFAKARQTSPTIIFFDELDAIAPKRTEGGENNVSERVVNQLLTEMDGLEELYNISIVASTNRPDIIDGALLRPGRFDRLILVPAPDEKTRKKIFSVHLKDMSLGKDVNVSTLVKRTKGYTGADINSVCREAGIIALRKNIGAKAVTQKNFLAALEVVKPSVSAELGKVYKELKDSLRASNENELKPSYLG